MDESEVTAEELRELIREGHGMIKDLTATMKAARVVMNDARALIQEAADAPKVETETAIRAVTAAAMERIADEVAETAKEASTFVQDVIFERFNVLMDVMVGLDQGKRDASIPDLLRAHAEPPKIDLDALDGVLKPLRRTT